MEILAPDEIETIERHYADGLPARAILEIFRPKGVRLSEATFRKYVQAGLLPRSRRVGEKGKHRGSHGLYPVESVRRINAIKKMMAEGLTLEDIKQSFVVYRNHIDQVERGVDELLDLLESALNTSRLGVKRSRLLHSEVESLRARAAKLMDDVARLGSAVTARAQGETSGYTSGA